MEPQKYNEVRVDKKTQEEIKVLRSVMIDEGTAKMLNGDTKVTGILYRLTDTPTSKKITEDEKAERADLLAKLKEAGKSVPGITKTETLRQMVSELKTE
jgi:hypothetical protein